LGCGGGYFILLHCGSPSWADVVGAVISVYGERREKSQEPQAALPSLGGQAGQVTSPHLSPQARCAGRAAR